MDSISDIIKSKTSEYIQKEGFVTCEFAGTKDGFEKNIKLLIEESKRLESFGARWTAMECSTCAEYHGEDYTLHFEIIEYQHYPKNSGIVFDAGVVDD